MAVYRSDQAQLTFGPEAAPGGYAMNFPGAVLGGSANTTLDGVVLAGATQITLTAASSFAVGQDIRIGPSIGGNSAVISEAEVRRITFWDSTNKIAYLDAPLAFRHVDDTDVDQVDTDGAHTTNAIDITMNQVPGVYDTVDVPDMVPTFEPRYFLGTQSKRNFFTVLKGQQAFTGSVAGFVLLNGRPLRYPFGKLVTKSNGTVTGRTYLANDAAKGDIFISLNANPGTTFAADKLITFDHAASPVATSISEIRKIVSISGLTCRLDYPLSFAHTADTSGTDQIGEVTTATTYAHHIFETVDLDTVSWHVHMRDSGETAANDFDRTYFGGLIGSASLAADEGGMLNMSWDGVNFLGMKHNQLFKTNNTTNIPHAGVLQKIASGDVDFPTSNPYFFSQGSVKLFGVEVARVRNFNLTVANGEEPRYYIQRRYGEQRGPTEIREQRREYSMAVTLALPDSQASTATATTLFKEFMYEADYGAGIKGFNIELTFSRSATDTITIRIPDDYTSGNEATGAGTGGNEIGAILRGATHSITGDNPVQVDADILFRNLKIEVTDGLYYYP